MYDSAEITILVNMMNPNKQTQLLFIVIVLALAALACNAAGTITDPTLAPTNTPAPDVPTATPAEEVTAEPTEDNVPAEPTETPTGGTDAEGMCVGPGAPALPGGVPAFADLPGVINTFLDAGGDTGTLTASMQGWGNIVTYEGMGTFGGIDLADLSGDGINEVIITAVNPEGPPPVTQQPPPGGLLIFTCFQGRYVQAHADWVPDDRATGMPVVLDVTDLTGDSYPDVVAARTNCGAHTCYQSVNGATFDGPGDGMAPLVPSGEFIDAPSPDISVSDNTGDGVDDVLVQTGYIGSVGAGPQRTFLDTYAWDGSKLARVGHVLTSGEAPIHVVNDADALFAAGEYQAAIEQYIRVYTDETLERDIEMGGPATFYELETYARYRIMLAYAALGDTEQAQSFYEGIDVSYPENPPVGEGWFAIPARAFWQNFETSSDLSSACTAALDSMGISEAFDIPLNQWGYANTYYEIIDLCPFAGS